jgi:ADP-heptose:LPS heptosyltransferase
MPVRFAGKMGRTLRAIKDLMERSIAPVLAVIFLTCVRAGYFFRRQKSAERTSIFISFPFNSMGDCLMLVPFLEYLRATWPNARCHLAVGDRMAPLFSATGIVDKVIPIKTVSHKGVLVWRFRELGTLISCSRNIRQETYDWAISPRWGSDAYARASRYLMYLVGARKRISYSANVDDGARILDRLSTETGSGGALDQESVRQIRLLERAGLARLDAGVEESLREPRKSLISIAQQRSPEQVRSNLRRCTGQEFADYICIAPGATKATHRWPAERFRQLIRELHGENKSQFILVGAEADAELCNSICNALPGIAWSIAGKTTVAELASIFLGAKLFIGCDSGPAHLAGGIGLPTIVLSPFALNSDQTNRDSSLRWRPNGPFVTVIQPEWPLSPCLAGCSAGAPHCVLQVTPDHVISAASKYIVKHPAAF